jgi:hydrogenase small subunit
MHTDWPIGAGHPCIGCTEVQFYDRFTPFYQVLPQVKVPGLGVEADATKVGLVLLGAVGVGVAAHATATAVWERREARAADKVNVPLLGDVVTRETSAPAPVPPPDSPPASDAAGTAGTDEGDKS